VFLVVYPHPRIAPGIRIKQGGGAVGRAAVDDYELELAEGLREDAVNGLTQKALAIEDGHHDGG
jgi:hypothetical protein